MTVTIKDVAREAKVSVATVSRVLNGHDNVTQETREAVLQVAKRLRFVPSGAARSLITRRTHTVGALLPDLHGDYFNELIRGIDLAARARGLHLLISSSHGDTAGAATALRAMNGRVDGLLVMSPHLDLDFLEGNVADGLPLVLMNSRDAHAQHDSFAVDNFGGAQAMTQHLLQMGHRRIAFLAGPATNYEAQERLRGYRSALAGQPADASEEVLQGDFSEESGWRAGKRLALQADRATAVFAANDMMAIGCLAALNEAGLRVPEEISLAGFDDIPISRYVSPPLTSVRAHVLELGTLALERLAMRMEAPAAAAARHQLLKTELVIRQSVAAPKP